MISLLSVALEDYACPACEAAPKVMCAGGKLHPVRLGKASADPAVIRATAQSMMYSGETHRLVDGG